MKDHEKKRLKYKMRLLAQQMETIQYQMECLMDDCKRLGHSIIKHGASTVCEICGKTFEVIK